MNSNLLKTLFAIWASLFSVAACVTQSRGQCSTSVAPSFSASPVQCLNEYITDISASGPGVTSTIAVSGGMGVGYYYDYSSTQGVNLPVGNTVTIHLTRCSTVYTGYVAIYADWDNDGIYNGAELSSPVTEFEHAATTMDYELVVPCGSTSNVNLSMRIMLSETRAGVIDPCAGTYGQAYQFHVNVNCWPLPSTATVCAGDDLSLPTGIPCGGWSSVNTAIATVSSAGVVTGVAAGTVYIVFAPATCTASPGACLVTVTPAASITGGSYVCTGLTTTLTGAASGGTWSTNDPSVATVSSSGVVSGVAAGAAIITYTAPVTSCQATKIVSVMATVPAITGTTTICQGTTTTLAHPVPGGTWSSSNTAIGTISTAGVLRGMSAGTVTLSYSLGFCAPATLSVTILPAEITGSSGVCYGASITLTGNPSGGTWASNYPGTASVSSGGVVTGLTGGAPVITYFAPNGCTPTKTIYVEHLYLSGFNGTCVGSSMDLNPVAPGSEGLACDGCYSGGTWSSSNTSVATVGTSGLVSGVAGGTATISWTSPLGCVITKVVTVASGTITGSMTVCINTSAPLSDGIPGGVWSSSNTAVGTVSSSGVVRGIAVGTATISHTGSGCANYALLTVVSPSLSGSSTVCRAGTTTLSATHAGGTWTTSNSGLATVGGGVVYGNSGGTVAISYAIYGCVVTHIMTVEPTISGTDVVCLGGSIILTATPSGGTWSSSNTGIATVSGGTVSGVAPGNAVITYTSPAGCVATKDVHIPFINGPTALCPDGAVTLYPNAYGGTWSSSGTGFTTAVAGSDLIVTGISAGSGTFTYYIGGCTSVAYSVTIHAKGITGVDKFCSATFPTLVGAPAVSGTTVWTSGNPAIISVSGGTLSGYNTGSTVITYNVPWMNGCMVTKTVSAYKSPVATAWTSCATLCYRPYGNTWENNLAATPTGGVWQGVGLTVITDPDIGIYANARVHPTGWWSGGYAKYTLSYDGGTMPCPVFWNYSTP
ncbi:MAG: Ig-like domain-containing protein [Bacteroidota bacterium]